MTTSPRATGESRPVEAGPIGAREIAPGASAGEAAKRTQWTGDRVRALRERLAWTGVELALCLGCAKTAVSGWEHNRNAPAPYLAAALDDLESVADAFSNGTGRPRMALVVPLVKPEAWPAKRIRKLRRRLRWRQADLAVALGVTKSAPAQWETRHPPGARMRRLLSLLAADLRDFPDDYPAPAVVRSRVRLGGRMVRRRATAKQLIR